MKKMSKLKKVTLGILAGMMFSNTALAFSVNFAPGTPVADAIRALGYKAGINVVINGDLNGTVSMSMDDTDFDTALRALARTNDFSYEYLDMMHEMSGLKCPLGGDETDDCADCAYSCDYHFVNGECVRREENN